MVLKHIKSTGLTADVETEGKFGSTPASVKAPSVLQVEDRCRKGKLRDRDPPGPAREENSLKRQKRRSSNAIEEIFATAKAAVQDKDKCKQTEAEAEGARRVVKGSKDDLFGNEPENVRRVTEEGYRIYREDELKIDQGGSTDLCPFDCDCCF